MNTSLISRRWQFWIDREVLEEIRRLKQRLGLTAAYVTHDQSEALALSDQIIVLHHGVIAQAGTPHDLYDRPSSEFVAGFMGEANWVRRWRSAPSSAAFASTRSLLNSG